MKHKSHHYCNELFCLKQEEWFDAVFLCFPKPVTVGDEKHVKNVTQWIFFYGLSRTGEFICHMHMTSTYRCAKPFSHKAPSWCQSLMCAWHGCIQEGGSYMCCWWCFIQPAPPFLIVGVLMLLWLSSVGANSILSCSLHNPNCWVSLSVDSGLVQLPVGLWIWSKSSTLFPLQPQFCKTSVWDVWAPLALMLCAM